MHYKFGSNFQSRMRFKRRSITPSLRYEFFVHYALRFEKMYQHDRIARPLEFPFLRQVRK